MLGRYVNAYGSMSHVFHMHGNGYRYQGNSGYAISVNDGEGKTLYMNATGAGLWQVICHVSCVPSYLLLGIARGGVPG